MAEDTTGVISDVKVAHQQNAKLKMGRFLKVYGPGLIVMLADTDAGCLITAAQLGCTMGICDGFATIIAYSNSICSAGNDGSLRHCDAKRPW